MHPRVRLTGDHFCTSRGRLGRGRRAAEVALLQPCYLDGLWQFKENWMLAKMVCPTASLGNFQLSTSWRTASRSKGWPLVKVSEVGLPSASATKLKDTVPSVRVARARGGYLGSVGSWGMKGELLSS
jgi:hypothetical protein